MYTMHELLDCMLYEVCVGSVLLVKHSTDSRQESLIFMVPGMPCACWSIDG